MGDNRIARRSPEVMKRVKISGHQGQGQVTQGIGTITDYWLFQVGRYVDQNEKMNCSIFEMKTRYILYDIRRSKLI